MSDLRTRAAEAAFLAAVEGGPSSKAWDLVGDSRREMWYEVADAVIAVLSEGLEEAREALLEEIGYARADWLPIVDTLIAAARAKGINDA